MPRLSVAAAFFALLPACTSPSGGPGTDDAAETGTPGDTGDTGTGREPPIATTQVLVVGGGASGLSAAVSALEQGAEVLVLEREIRAGGASEYAANLWAVGTRWQEAQGITDSPETAIAEWAEFTGGEAPTEWVDAYVRGSAETLDWLAEHGATFSDTVSSMEKTGSVPRVHALQAPVVTAMAMEIEEVLRTETTVTGLVVDRDGRVIGVTAEDGWFEAGAVVLATGGFARNRERVNASRPDVAAFDWYMEAWPGMTGSGQEMVEALGVTLAHPERIGLFAHAVADGILGFPEVMQPSDYNNALLVDATGARLARGLDGDLVDDEHMVEQFLERGPVYAVVDAAQLAPMSFSGRGFNYEGPGAGQLDSAAYVAAVGLPAYDTTDALASGAGFDPSVLAASVADWNGAVAANEDTTFGEPMDGRTAVATSPFYALPMVLSSQKSFGGAPLDTSARVLFPDGTPVPGLYAAGEMAGFLGGADLGHGWNGSVSACYFVGRAAGAAAAIEVTGAR